MIPYQQSKFRELNGEFEAVINDVVVEKNGFYDPSKNNSTELTLSIGFDLTDPENGEVIPFVQKFVSPLTGGSSLFQQLLDVVEHIPDLEGGEFDEQSFVGLNVVVTMGKRQAKDGKEYPKVDSVRKATDKRPSKPKAKKEATVEDVFPA